MPGRLSVALISELFLGEGAAARLRERLREARSRGADVAVLPELPLNPWSPASRTPLEQDAEPPGGPRHRMQAGAAREAGIGLVGGAIVADPAGGRRHNTALVFDTGGRLLASYRKLHLPREEGFWEADHYEPGAEPPSVIDGFGMLLGVQLCSDINRPEGSHILGAMGAEVILVPRASERGTYDRWGLVLRANAVTSAAYVLSVNRPAAENGVPFGGPSVAVAPDGAPVIETAEALAVVTLERDAVLEARRRYPGYLPVRDEVYARGWRMVREGR